MILQSLWKMIIPSNHCNSNWLQWFYNILFVWVSNYWLSDCAFTHIWCSVSLGKPLEQGSQSWVLVLSGMYVLMGSDWVSIFISGWHIVLPILFSCSNLRSTVNHRTGSIDWMYCLSLFPKGYKVYMYFIII